MQKITIWHHPRCSKSRKALELLREKGIEPEIREYLKNPPTRTEIQKILDLLEKSPIEIVRQKEPEFSDFSKDDPDKKIIDALVKFPKLLERPIVFSDQKAIIGRPPEKVLGFL